MGPFFLCLKKNSRCFARTAGAIGKIFVNLSVFFDLNNKDKLFFLKIWNCKLIVHTFVRTKKQYY